MIELKEPYILEDLVKILNRYNILKECFISGRILSELLKFKKIYPNNKICYNITKGQGLSLKKFMKLGKKNKIRFKIDFINLHSSLITQEFIEICHKNKINSLAWDFLIYNNPLRKIKSLINLGIDGILFDNHNNIPIIKRWQTLL
jgi:hypothetical protein